MRQIPALTSLRFFAAVVVVGYHDGFGLRIFHLGSQAVTFFFILSGFVLTYAHGRERLNYRAFIIARAARILPAYYFALAMAAPFVLYRTVVSGQSPANAGFAAVPVLIQAWIPPVATAWNLPAWSLSVEAFFYALFPALCLVVAKLKPMRALGLAFAVVVAVDLVRLFYFQPENGGTLWANFCGYFPPFHLPQFIFGVALARVFLASSVSSMDLESLLIAGISAFCAILVLLDIAPWLLSNISLTVVFGSIILGGAGGSGLVTRVLSVKPLIFLVDASYAIYIAHFPLLMWWQRIVRLPPNLSRAGLFCSVIALSAFILIAIERPGRAWILKRFRTIPQQQNIAVVSAMR
jgi:peptidoglycan/LPS O-acetylase OafA/YrhL